RGCTPSRSTSRRTGRRSSPSSTARTRISPFGSSTSRAATPRRRRPTTPMRSSCPGRVPPTAPASTCFRTRDASSPASPSTRSRREPTSVSRPPSTTSRTSPDPPTAESSPGSRTTRAGRPSGFATSSAASTFRRRSCRPARSRRSARGCRCPPTARGSRSSGTGRPGPRRCSSSTPQRDALPATESRAAGLSALEFREPKLIRYESFDGRQIPAWLYRPDADGRAPYALLIHGGPEAQERPLFRPYVQYLLSRGIGVLATNIRGSTGYGKTYQKLIHHDWGGGDLEDWRHAAEWLRAQPFVDGDRLAVFGGSYGGFATLTCVTRLPEYWRAAVDIVGPSNLVTFVRAVPPQWLRFMAE